MLAMSGLYQVGCDRVLPHACREADPLHVVRSASGGVGPLHHHPRPEPE